jgi:hypothetical protein
MLPTPNGPGNKVAKSSIRIPTGTQTGTPDKNPNGKDVKS